MAEVLSDYGIPNELINLIYEFMYPACDFCSLMGKAVKWHKCSIEGCGLDRHGEIFKIIAGLNEKRLFRYCKACRQKHAEKIKERKEEKLKDILEGTKPITEIDEFLQKYNNFVNEMSIPTDGGYFVAVKLW